MRVIGLFPLNLVLFPGSSYPLHIFENRYKLLIHDSLSGETEFGVNLMEENKVYEFGCMARVSNVLNEYDDGRMDIVVTGTERFRIAHYQSGSKPYLMAEPEIISDSDPRPGYELLNETVTLYNQLIESVYGENEEWLDAHDWIEGGAAFRMAQKAGLELPIRQRLLEMRTENERLVSLRAYLQDLMPRVKAMEKVQALIRNDGYLE